MAHEVGLIVVLLAIFSLDGSLLATRGSIKGASLATGSLMWSALLLAEASRAPFDFAESESELVAGLQVEVSASAFTLMFVGGLAIAKVS